MDSTDTLALKCPLSKWSGLHYPDRCRLCDRKLSGRSRKYCTRRCSRIWAYNHRYRKARVEARRRARGPCSCPERKSDVKCESCGRCEGELKRSGSRLECNHTVARNGVPINSYSCIHHVDLLEILCSECHRKVTQKQKLERRLGTNG